MDALNSANKRTLVTGGSKAIVWELTLAMDKSCLYHRSIYFSPWKLFTDGDLAVRRNWNSCDSGKYFNH